MNEHETNLAVIEYHISKLSEEQILRVYKFADKFRSILEDGKNISQEDEVQIALGWVGAEMAVKLAEKE